MENLKHYFYALRPQHWIKNSFIFLPLIFGGKLFVFTASFKTTLAFLLFSLTASGVYLINDVIDAEKDKLHPTKRLRPVAAGKIKKKDALVLGIGLQTCSLALSFFLNASFGLIVLTYLIFNYLYSKFLKEAVIIDTFCLAGFFLLRVLAGGVVSGCALSHWIVIMATLLALFLGFNKRRQELQMLQRGAYSHRHVLRKYSAYFIDQMVGVVTSSIVIAYLLYSIDPRTVAEVGSKNFLWTVPFVYYGIFRYLYLVHRVRRDDDPTRILMTDRKMHIDIFLWAVSCIIVIYGKF